jgi:hypothetical protein
MYILGQIGGQSQQDTQEYRLREADIRTQLGDRWIESQQDTQGYRLREADIRTQLEDMWIESARYTGI